MTRQYFDFYSEYGEDRWISEHLPLPPGGVYVDIGCAHPVQYSNTAFLRDAGWTGLAIDGNAGYAPHWRDVRGTTFLACAIGNPGNKFFIEPNAACSRLVTPDEVENVPLHAQGCVAEDVAVLPLQFVLESHEIGVIDFMSLDAEGGEFDALRSFNLARHAPGIIVAEYNTNGQKDYRLRDHLLEVNYELVHTTVANFIFVKR